MFSRTVAWRVFAPSFAIPQAAQFALAAFAVLMWPSALLNDPDTLWHIRTGEWMIDHRRVLDFDPFSHTRAGAPWNTHEWLTEVLMAAIYRVGGWSGLMVATAAAAAACVYILVEFAGRSLRGLPILLALTLGLSLVSPHYLARPHLFALPLLAVWTVALVTARNENRAPPLLLLPVMALWANMHGSFFLGICLIGPFALEALVEAAPEDRRKTFFDWGGFGVGAALAALATPHGLGGLIFPVKLIMMPGITGIMEWAPADFSAPAPLEISLLATMFLLFRFGVAVPVFRLLLLLGLLHLTLAHQRYEIILGVIGVILLAEPAAAALATRAARSETSRPETSRPGRASPLFLGVAAIAAALSVCLRFAIPAPEAGARHMPVTALAAVPDEIAALPVLNDYGAGGYLIWNGVRPFIDGRADMYGPEFLRSYFAIMNSGGADLDAALSEYDIRWTLLRNGSAAAGAMNRTPGWTRLFADDEFIVHVRSDSL